MNYEHTTTAGSEIDDELVQQCDEIRAIAKKDWFKPASVSLAKLDQVKAKVLNINLTDARSLRAVHRRPPPSPSVTPAGTASTLSDLHTEPPLSTLSYQKAAWGSGSEPSIPEAIRKAGGGGIRPSRPSSAKVASCTRPPLAKKSRPQSAKDPLCPPGKKKAAFGVKGQRYDPSDRSHITRDASPQSFPATVIGWAGPPAGLNIPCGQDGFPGDQTVPGSQDHDDCDGGLFPSAPHTSPEPEENELNGDVRQESPAPPTGIHLSLSLPSADVDASEEPDTGRLLEEADKFVQTQKTKEARRMKLFQGDKGGGGFTSKSDISGPKDTFFDEIRENDGGIVEAEMVTKEAELESVPGTVRLFSDRSEIFADLSSSEDDYEDPAINISRKEQEEVTEDTYSVENLSGLITSASGQSISATTSSGDSGFSTLLETTVDEVASNEMSLSDAELPQQSGYKYLGPPKHEKKSRTHPIFLMPEDKQLQPHPPLTGSKQDGMKLFPHHRPGDHRPGDHRPGHHQPGHHRPGVHIREDCNVTVDITPRNLGRKVKDKSPSKNVLVKELNDDVAEWGEGRPTPSPLARPSSASQGGSDLEVTAFKMQNKTASGTQAATITVCYDDDDDSDGAVKKEKKKQKRSRPVKEKDLVTMVSNLGLSGDEDEDDPGKEVDLPLGREGDADSGPDHRTSSVVSVSSREKNYFDIARHRRSGSTGPSLEEKENFITMTTKTFQFDAERPTESIVKKILEAPLLKQRERDAPSSMARPKSAAQKLRASKLVASEMHCVTPPRVKPAFADRGDNWLQDDKEERPSSRMGFVSMETAQDTEDECEKAATTKEELHHRPPSGRRRPLSATNKVNSLTGSEGRQSRKRIKESVGMKHRPSSASPCIGRSPSAVDIQRANAAVRAMRSEETTTSGRSSSASRLAETRKKYAHTCQPRCGSQSRDRSRVKSAPVGGRAIQLNSKNPLLQEEDTESLEECRGMQDRLACYGIDVKAETLERALYPPSGRTLYYDISAELPRSYSTGLLSHPRVWLPEEHRKLRIAEKKLAMAELSLWRQKQQEERKARLAAAKEAGRKGKKGKKKGKGKKLRRSQSIC